MMARHVSRLWGGKEVSIWLLEPSIRWYGVSVVRIETKVIRMMWFSVL